MNDLVGTQSPEPAELLLLSEAGPRPKRRSVRSAIKSAWSRWLKFAELLGNIQMILILSLIYWTLLAFIAIPFRLLSDPLSLRRPHRRHWTPRHPVSNVLESMKKEG